MIVWVGSMSEHMHTQYTIYFRFVAYITTCTVYSNKKSENKLHFHTFKLGCPLITSICEELSGSIPNTVCKH